jgi:hypothetical protein
MRKREKSTDVVNLKLLLAVCWRCKSHFGSAGTPGNGVRCNTFLLMKDNEAFQMIAKVDLRPIRAITAIADKD